MRAVCIILVIASIAAGVGSLLVFYAASWAAGDGLYGSYRERLAAEVGRDKANIFTGEASRTMSSIVRESSLWIGIPLGITNAAWAIFGVWIVRRRDAEPAPSPPG